MNAEVAALVADPAWLPHRLSSAGDAVTFVRLTREDQRTVTFLDDQYFEGRFPMRTVPLRDLQRHVRTDRPIHGIDFIFHSSMALSTLAARLFDLPGVALGLKEPIILNQLADWSRAGPLDPGLLPLMLALLGRPLAPDERVVIKASNVANRLIPPLMAAAPTARALILHAPLDDFLLSIAKRGLAGRIFYRRQFLMLRSDFGIDGGFSDRDLFEQTDLQITALAWLNHHAQFARLLPALGARARAVSSRDFLTHRAAATAALTRFLALPIGDTVLNDSPAFRQHSKQLGKTYDAAARATDYAGIEAAYGEEIGMVTGWAARVAQHHHVPMVLPSQLLS